MEQPLTQVKTDTASTEPEPQVNHEISKRQAARRRRAMEYQLSALDKEDPLRAVLASLNSGMMLASMGLDEAIERALGEGPATLERVQKLLPTMDMNHRLARQIGRFVQLELRLMGLKDSAAGAHLKSEETQS